MRSRDYQEKRDFRRMELDQCPLAYRVENSGETGSGVVRNLSGSGLLMVLDREFPLGTMLEVKITPLRSLVPPLEARAELVRVTKEGVGRYAVGAVITMQKDQA